MSFSQYMIVLFIVTAQFRDRDTGHIKIEFDEGEKSVSPGQAAVLYDDEWCLGCGIIERTS